MEKFYTIKEDFAEIILSKNIYPLTTIKKALTNFMDDIYTKIEDRDDKIIVQILLKRDKISWDKLIGELYNDFLRESLRYNISLETKNLRELIIGRALYTTCIDIEENEKEKNEVELEDKYSIDEIAVNWFDKYEKKEEDKC